MCWKPSARFTAMTQWRGNRACQRRNAFTFHQEHGKAVIDKLHGCQRGPVRRKAARAELRIGQAISYLLNRCQRLTIFLEKPKAILHRKNSLFYKTSKGAQVGDLYMSLIHTCELNGANPFDYLTELQKHAAELANNPAAWMPWNYGGTLERADATPDAG